jgi:hypothetical protein
VKKETPASEPAKKFVAPTIPGKSAFVPPSIPKPAGPPKMPTVPGGGAKQADQSQKASVKDLRERLALSSQIKAESKNREDERLDYDGKLQCHKIESKYLEQKLYKARMCVVVLLSLVVIHLL